MTGRHLIILDLETNGRDVRRHDAWEVAWWNVTTGDRGLFLPYLTDGPGTFLANAELEALRVCRFIDRWTDDYRHTVDYGVKATEQALYDFTMQAWPNDGERSVMVCAQPKFDLPFMSKLLRRTDLDDEPWFHRAIDLASYACSALGIDPADPPGASTVARLVGVEGGDHSAEADVTSTGRAFLILRALAAAKAGTQHVDTDTFLATAPRGADIERTLIR